jgi:hypothetical protein
MTEPIAERRPLVGLPGTRKSVPDLPFTVRAHAEETGGALEVDEVGVPDARAGLGAGPPPHVHREHEETRSPRLGSTTPTPWGPDARSPQFSRPGLRTRPSTGWHQAMGWRGLRSTVTWKTSGRP